ncbi:tetratricopeptide repeat protein [Micromonospora sp. DPT]|uniref:tetratricopeptide repeat protein n=1 Tax=Micromonospora sp. DPT TaxID=3142975 RepID=UPI00320817F7
MVISEIAHIVAEKPDGPRGEFPLSRAERDSYDNLMLLCNVHHQLIDSQPTTYTVEWLREVKFGHERFVEQRLGGIDAARPLEMHRRVTHVDPRSFPVASVVNDPAEVGIHPAIPLSATVPGLDPRLPAYIRRDVDTGLRQELRDLLSRGGFVVVVGGAVCGKTRTAFEAVRAELPEWRMFIPAEAAEINGLATADVDGGRIVVWVDDLVEMLSDPDLSVRAFRDLVGDPANPVVIVGSLSPESYDQLQQPPDASHPDRFRVSRQLLKLARRWDVPMVFSAAELKEAEAISGVDPRIHEARHHAAESGSPIEVLACAPQMISRYTTAGRTSGRAVVDAAVEARLSGHSRVIPVELLRQLTELRMSPADKATASADWFEAAARWACQPVRGVVPLLSPYGRVIGQLDGYAVSDIIASHVFSSTGFRHRAVQAAAWELLSTTPDIDSCLPVGFNALQLGHVQVGRRALQRAAEAEVELAASILGMSHLDDGELDEALHWLTVSYGLGAADMAGLIAVAHSRLGDGNLAKDWLEIAAETGDLSAMFGLGQLHEDAGDDTLAYQWYADAAEGGFGPALTGLGILHANRGEDEAAVGLWKQAAAAGDPTAMMNLARTDWNAGRSLGAERWWRAAAELDVVEAMALLAERLLDGERDIPEAMRWARRAAEALYPPAWGLLGHLLTEHGDADEGLSWLMRGAEADQINAIGWLAERLDDIGDLAGAERWMARLANDPEAPVVAQARYGIFLHMHGRTGEATEWLHQAFDSGDHDARGILSLVARTDPVLSAMLFPAVGDVPPPRAVPYPQQVQWTPIEQNCGCVIDWGWDQQSDPVAFMTWCSAMAAANCIWHGAESGKFPAPPPDVTISLRDPRSGVSFYARRAQGDDDGRGRELTTQLRDLAGQTREELIATMPEQLRDYFVDNGYDPAEQWLDTRLTDIILNSGNGIDWSALDTMTDARDAAEPPGHS